VLWLLGLLLAATRKERARQSRAKQRHGHRFGNRGGGIDTDAPSLGACIAPIRQIGGKEHALVIADKIVGAEAAGAGQCEKQIAKIAVARAVTRGVINRDPEVAKGRVAATGRVEAQTFGDAAVGVLPARWCGEADAKRTRAGQIEGERRVRPAGIDEAIAVLQINRDINGIGAVLRQGDDADISWLHAGAVGEDPDGSGKGGGRQSHNRCESES